MFRYNDIFSTLSLVAGFDSMQVRSTTIVDALHSVSISISSPTLTCY